MKRNNLNEIKELDIKALFEKAKALKLEINEGVMDKNMDKHKDLKTVSKKRKDLAQILTIHRQKQQVLELEKKAEGRLLVTEPKSEIAKKEPKLEAKLKKNKVKKVVVAEKKGVKKS
jgi:ribosomal protein L29